MASRMNIYDARRIMATIGCKLSADFHTLNSAQVDQVLIAARQYGYRKPRNANGSKARYFFQFVQRTAHRKAY